MTVSTSLSRKVYSGNDATVDFPTVFAFYETSDIVVRVLDTVDDSDTLKVEGTDYSVSGGDGTSGTVTFVTAPTSTQTVVIYREIPYTQPTPYRSSRALPGPTFEDSLDRLTYLGQQVKTAFDLSVKVSIFDAPEEDIPSYSLAAPSDGYIVVGNSEGTGWINALLASISGSPVLLPLSLALGGTGATTAAGARSALELGSAALLDTGTSAGNVPVLDGSGLVNPAILPEVDGSNPGVLPAFTASNQIYDSTDGWTDSWTEYTALDSDTLTVAGDVLEVAAASTEWDEYDEFLVILDNAYASAANCEVGMYWNISGTWRNSLEYVSSIHGWSHIGDGQNGTTTGAKGNVIRIDTVDNAFADSALRSCEAVFRVRNLYKQSTSNSIQIFGHVNYIRDDGAPLGVLISGRNATNLGYFRGVRFEMINTGDGDFVIGSRLRIFGVTRHGAF